MANLINAKTSGVGGLETTADNTGNINIQSGGSTVMEVTSAGVAVTGSLTQNGEAYSTQPTFRNRIINGNMTIDQRNAGASVTNVSANSYTTDRFYNFGHANSKFTSQQVTDAPESFNYSLKNTSLSAYSVGASEAFLIAQIIEGFNAADLAWGTAYAKTVTLSFWVRSSLTGTFGGSLRNSAGNRSYPYSYTISSADTWEKKSITVPGETTGTWLTTNGSGIRLTFSLGTGSTYSGTAGSWAATNYLSVTGATSVVGTSGATLYITGVQLEAGTTATDFENLQYGQQMQLCQRYFYSLGGTASYEFMTHGMYVGTTTPLLRAELPVKMRAAPTLGSTGTFLAKSGNSNLACASFSVDQAATQTFSFSATISGGSSTVGYATLMFANASTATRLTFSAEL